jgi:hypothetical protein
MGARQAALLVAAAIAACGGKGRDVEPGCGNGIVEEGETCDGDCPSSCDDLNACTTDTMSGSAPECSVTCSHARVTACEGGDGCCPSECTSADDGDCPVVTTSGECGNDETEPGEACDGSDLNGFSCTTLAAGFVSGTLACKPDCSGYDASGCVHGGSVAAADCSQAAVQAAVDAAADGDTVLIPAGTCTWTTPTGGGPAIVVEDRAIVLRGSGVDRTIIRDATGPTGDVSVLVPNGGGAKPFRVTGFTIRRERDEEDTDTFFVLVTGPAKSYRVDHMTFVGSDFNTPDSAVFVTGDVYGVVDHCTLVGGAARIGHYGSDDESWKRPLAYGTAEAVYIEDNVLDSDYEGTEIYGVGMEAGYGGRYVFRYNSVRGGYAGNHGAHGSRGTFSMEIYANVFVWAPLSWTPLLSRGGTAVIYDNVLTGDFPDFINLYYDRSCREGSQGLCDGSNPLDGNEDPSGYPCLDQIGRATDASGGSVHPQAPAPVYEWNNLLDGEDIDMMRNPGFESESPECPAQHAAHVQEGRDYFNDTECPGYVPYVHPHPLVPIE